MMLNDDDLADEFDAILNYRTTHEGLVLAGEEVFPSWLSFGSTDSSIVYQNTLTAGGAAALSTQGLTATVVGNAAGPTHDPVSGMRAWTGSADSAYRIVGFSGAQQTALTAGGQITFEVRSIDWAAINGNATGSSGANQTQSEAYAFSFNNNDNTNNGRISVARNASEQDYLVCTNGASDTNSSLLAFNGWVSQVVSGAGASAAYFNNYRYPTAKEYLTINIGWYTDGGNRRLILSVDGQVLATMLRTDTSNPFAGSLMLGAKGNFFFGPVGDGTTAGTFWNHGYIRNFQLSSLAPVVPAESDLGALAILSDSIIAATSWWNNGFRDINITTRIHRAVEMTGKRLSAIHRVNAGGHQLDDTGTLSSFKASTDPNTAVNNTPVALVADPRGNVKATTPKTLIINGGSNDVTDFGTITAVSFADAIKDHICYFLGLNSTGWVSTGGTDYGPAVTTLTRIFLTNITDRETWDATAKANAATLRAVFNGIPESFAAQFPGNACTIHVIDTFNAMGGETLYTGKYTEASPNGIHPGYAGMIRIGDAIAAALATYA